MDHGVYGIYTRLPVTAFFLHHRVILVFSCIGTEIIVFNLTTQANSAWLG